MPTSAPSHWPDQTLSIWPQAKWSQVHVLLYTGGNRALLGKTASAKIEKIQLKKSHPGEWRLADCSKDGDGLRWFPRVDAGHIVGKTGDGAVDVITNEDKLALGVVYMQAKRWKNRTDGSQELREFVGALSGRKARAFI